MRKTVPTRCPRRKGFHSVKQQGGSLHRRAAFSVCGSVCATHFIACCLQTHVQNGFAGSLSANFCAFSGYRFIGGSYRWAAKPRGRLGFVACRRAVRNKACAALRRRRNKGSNVFWERQHDGTAKEVQRARREGRSSFLCTGSTEEGPRGFLFFCGLRGEARRSHQ